MMPILEYLADIEMLTERVKELEVELAAERALLDKCDHVSLYGQKITKTHDKYIVSFEPSKPIFFNALRDAMSAVITYNNKK